MENLDVNNEVIENNENVERAITLIDKCQDDNNELIEYRNKIKKEIKRLEASKYFLAFAFVFTCFVKFPKVYNYDYLLNHIAIILELMAGFAVDCGRYVDKMVLDMTYETQDFVTEVNLDAAKEVLEEEKEKTLVKVK